MAVTADLRTALLVVFAASTALVLSALGMQYLGGLPPCRLCHWQRIPYAAIAVIAAVAFVTVKDRKMQRLVLAVCATLFLIDAGIAFYHAGVEYKWFPGPGACSGTITANTIEELQRQIMSAPLVRCEDVPWSLFGLSIAGYNFIAAAILTIATAYVAVRAARGEERTT